jgi:hypothetical protein
MAELYTLVAVAVRDVEGCRGSAERPRPAPPRRQRAVASTSRPSQTISAVRPPPLTIDPTVIQSTVPLRPSPPPAVATIRGDRREGGILGGRERGGEMPSRDRVLPHQLPLASPVGVNRQRLNPSEQGFRVLAPGGVEPPPADSKLVPGLSTHLGESGSSLLSLHFRPLPQPPDLGRSWPLGPTAHLAHPYPIPSPGRQTGEERYGRARFALDSEEIGKYAERASSQFRRLPRSSARWVRSFFPPGCCGCSKEWRARIEDEGFDLAFPPS